jgi:hypothetical protein
MVFADLSSLIPSSILIRQPIELLSPQGGDLDEHCRLGGGVV